MNHSLTRVLLTRTAEAEKRLMALTEQHERGNKPGPQLSKSALRELGDVLEELRVATEHLQLAADDLASARRDATAGVENYRELYEGLPMPCLLTNEQGSVDEANGHASKLLGRARTCRKRRYQSRGAVDCCRDVRARFHGRKSYRIS